MNTETLNIIIKAAFALLSAIVIYIIKPYIEQKVGANKYNEFCDFCIKAEAAAAQMFDNNDEKKEYVEKLLLKKAEEIGLSVDSTTVQATLEGVYKIYKTVINEGEQTL